MDRSFKTRMYVIIALFAAIVVIVLIGFATRLGKTAVTIKTIPADSKITINGKSAGAGMAYLKPGVYHFKAELDGWLPDEQTIKISGKSTAVYLLPTPNSDKATQWINDHPNLTLERESLGSEAADQTGTSIRQQNPIINLLPYTDISGPFQIDYGMDPDHNNRLFLLISYSTPDGRQAALKWIRSQGYDPTNLDIRFKDFHNPLLEAKWTVLVWEN